MSTGTAPTVVVPLAATKDTPRPYPPAQPVLPVGPKAYDNPKPVDPTPGRTASMGSRRSSMYPSA